MLEEQFQASGSIQRSHVVDTRGGASKKAGSVSNLKAKKFVIYFVSNKTRRIKFGLLTSI